MTVPQRVPTRQDIESGGELSIVFSSVTRMRQGELADRPTEAWQYENRSARARVGREHADSYRGTY